MGQRPPPWRYLAIGRRDWIGRATVDENLNMRYPAALCPRDVDGARAASFRG